MVYATHDFNNNLNSPVLTDVTKTGIRDIKAWFRLDRPSRLKKCSDDRDDHMETLPRRSQMTRAIQNLHDRPDHPDRTQFYPRDRGRLSRPGRLRSSG